MAVRNRRLISSHISQLPGIGICGIVGLLVFASYVIRESGRDHALAQMSQEAVVSADGVWTRYDEQGNTDKVIGARISTHRFRLSVSSLNLLLSRAPLESFRASSSGSVTITLPMPDGSYSGFRIEESPIMQPALAARYPEIKSYRGVDMHGTIVRLSWSPRGLHAFILDRDQSIIIHPENQSDITTYISYRLQDRQDLVSDFQCDGVLEHPRGDFLNQLRMATGTNLASGNVLRTYRIAVATTQEFSNATGLGGGTVQGTLAAINSLLNAVNAVYERELSIRFVLAANNDQVIYTAEPDPFTNGNTALLINEVRPVLRDRVGTANYDLGHVLGTSGGGRAYLATICDDGQYGGNGPIKGGGTSSVSASGPPASAVWTMAHEIGHMFSAPHNFNASCSGNRSSSSAFESGSGLTIMSYPGGCTPDAIVTSGDMRFHAGSLSFMNSYITALGTSCATQTNLSNNVPTVNGGQDYAIPRNTPFTLSAIGFDPDALDIPGLTYAWEQIDSGGSAYQNPPYSDGGDPLTTTRPVFRPFPATSSPSRTFPSLTYILNYANDPPDVINSLQTAEELPRVGRTLNFSVTIRDNRGGLSNDTIGLTVADSTGPFLVASPNSMVIWDGGSIQQITWSVNNTNLSPINCNEVNISLSLDGGSTFPIILAANTPNDGSETIIVPDYLYVTRARIKIEAVNNIFFDISDTDFSILPPQGCPGIAALITKAGHVGSKVFIEGINFSGIDSVIFGNGVSAPFNILSNSRIEVTVPGGAGTGPIKVARMGCRDAVTDVFNVCPAPPAQLSVDDGTYETSFGGGSGTSAFFVNRLTPGSYPATLTAVILNLNLPAGTSIDVVSGSNLDGDADINNTAFQFTPVTVTTLNQAISIQVPSLTIDSGDFIVGFRYVPATGLFPARFDRSSPSAMRSYLGNGTFFTLFDDLGPNFSGNLGIRALAYDSSCFSCDSSMSIESHPTDQIVCQDSSATFSVTVNGAGPFTYQWRKNGANITGANGSALNLGSVSSADAGSYDVIVTGSCSSVISDTALLEVNLPPSITAQPLSLTACPDSNAVFTAAAAGSPAPDVKWQVSTDGGTTYDDISGATRTTLMLINVDQSLDITRYRARFMNGCGVAVTNPAILTVASFAINPTNQTYPMTGGSGVVDVSISGACDWTAVSNDSWVTIDSGSSGNGNGIVRYSVMSNSGLSRNGTMIIAGHIFSVIQFATGLEADVAPRTNGSGTVVVSDWVQVGRFSVGLDTPAPGGEFQRADCAPRSTFGDGMITVADWVQAGRYSVGLDPLTLAGGPTQPGGSFAPLAVLRRAPFPDLPRSLRVNNPRLTPGQRSISVPIELAALGGENAVSFTLGFDPKLLSFDGYDPGLDAQVLIHHGQLAEGRVGIGMALRPGTTMAAGTREIIHLRFRILKPGAGLAEVYFVDGVTPLSLVSSEAEILPVQAVKSRPGREEQNRPSRNKQ